GSTGRACVDLTKGECLLQTFVAGGVFQGRLGARRAAARSARTATSRCAARAAGSALVGRAPRPTAAPSGDGPGTTGPFLLGIRAAGGADEREEKTERDAAANDRPRAPLRVRHLFTSLWRPRPLHHGKGCRTRARPVPFGLQRRRRIASVRRTPRVGSAAAV